MNFIKYSKLPKYGPIKLPEYNFIKFTKFKVKTSHHVNKKKIKYNCVKINFINLTNFNKTLHKLMQQHKKKYYIISLKLVFSLMIILCLVVIWCVSLIYDNRC